MKYRNILCELALAGVLAASALQAEEAKPDTNSAPAKAQAAKSPPPAAKSKEIGRAHV